MNSSLYEWIFWILIAVSAVLAVISVQLLLSRLNGKKQDDEKKHTGDD